MKRLVWHCIERIGASSYGSGASVSMDHQLFSEFSEALPRRKRVSERRLFHIISHYFHACLQIFVTTHVK